MIKGSLEELAAGVVGVTFEGRGFASGFKPVILLNLLVYLPNIMSLHTHKRKGKENNDEKNHLLK